ncbi:uncharacterized protein N7487_003492 [Penicillium crustosum]|uniref:uncharacterized protein n=1 Tax=Penicillium crustosum TaxID=36656 RepID=UPI002397A848|nr:uncharacterized protein N7487_003492 [Penicillium crustosum]KAJ5419942.1 hypothetical protein N7487_003492 [Penicillium crustosum]
MPIMPSLDQKQGLLGSPLHNHMLLYPYVFDHVSDGMPGVRGGVRFSADINYSGLSGLAE